MDVNFRTDKIHLQKNRGACVFTLKKLFIFMAFSNSRNFFDVRKRGDVKSYLDKIS